MDGRGETEKLRERRPGRAGRYAGIAGGKRRIAAHDSRRAGLCPAEPLPLATPPLGRARPSLAESLSPLLVLAALLAGCSDNHKEKTKAPLIGSFGTTKLRVPKDHAWIWEKDRESKGLHHTCGQPLKSALIQLRWPDMKPRNSKTAADFKKYHSGATGDSQWIEIGMTQASPGANLSLDRQRDWATFRSRPAELPLGVQLQYAQDSMTGLKVAFPNLQIKEGHAWNRRFFSDSFDQQHQPTVFISCMSGPQYHPPTWTPLCDHHLNAPGFEQAHLSVVYRQNLLPHWREIERDVRTYLRGIQSRC